MKLFPAFIVFLILSVSMVTACGKGGGGGGGTPPPASEANLAVTTDPANGAFLLPALGPYNLKVSVTSVMPPNGVKIDITAKNEATNTQFFSTSVNKTTAVNDFVITGTPAAATCVVEIKLTSLTKATNTWSGSYRYSSK